MVIGGKYVVFRGYGGEEFDCPVINLRVYDFAGGCKIRPPSASERKRIDERYKQRLIGMIGSYRFDSLPMHVRAMSDGSIRASVGSGFQEQWRLMHTFSVKGNPEAQATRQAELMAIAIHELAGGEHIASHKPVKPKTRMSERCKAAADAIVSGKLKVSGKNKQRVDVVLKLRRYHKSL